MHDSQARITGEMLKISNSNLYISAVFTQYVVCIVDSYFNQSALFHRFMPYGIYFDVKNYTEEDLASKMNELIENKEKYYDMFRWRNYYSYHSVAESGETDPLCAFCAFLNDDSKRTQRRVYARFTEWWNDLIMENDTIVQYEISGPKIKSYFSYQPVKYEPVPPTDSVLNRVNDFVDNLYNYFNPK